MELIVKLTLLSDVNTVVLIEMEMFTVSIVDLFENRFKVLPLDVKDSPITPVAKLVVE